jgi:dynein heavy chain
MDVHGRDVVKTMIKKNVQDINNFDWKKQLRYYWETEADDIFLK